MKQKQVYDNEFYLVTDRRTYKDRRDVFAVAKKTNYVAHEKAKGKISHNAPTGHSSRKPKQAAKKQESEEKQELVNPILKIILFIYLTFIIVFYSHHHPLKKSK